MSVNDQAQSGDEAEIVESEPETDGSERPITDQETVTDEGGDQGQGEATPVGSDGFTPRVPQWDTDPEVVGGLPLVVVYDILKNKRRRFVLLYLQSHEETVSIGELAEQIASYENDVPVKQLNAQQRKRVYIGLYQCHLPKMADADVIDFEQSRGEVRLGPRGPPLLEFLEESIKEDRTNARYYYAVVSAGVLVFALGQIAIPDLSWLSHVAVMILVVGVLALTYVLESREEED